MITLKDAIYLEKIDEVKRGSQNRQSESGTLHR